MIMLSIPESNIVGTHKRNGLAAFIAVIVTAMLGFVAEMIVETTPVTLIVLPGLLIWYLVFAGLLKEGFVVHFFPALCRCYYYEKKDIACLSLPDKTWVAVRAASKNERGARLKYCRALGYSADTLSDPLIRR